MNKPVQFLQETDNEESGDGDGDGDHAFVQFLF